MIKKHKPCIGDYVMAECYKAELAKVKKQLTIAVEALEKYSDLNNWVEVCDGKCTFESISGTEDHLAQDVLQKIKELENA